MKYQVGDLIKGNAASGIIIEISPIYYKIFWYAVKNSPDFIASTYQYERDIIDKNDKAFKKVGK